MKTLSSFVVAVAVLFSTARISADESAIPTPRWIWPQKERVANEKIALEATFEIKQPIQSAELVVAAEYCRGRVFINQQRAARSEPYGKLVSIDVAGRLERGANAITICCESVAGPSAVMARLQWTTTDGERHALVSDTNWRATRIDDINSPSSAESFTDKVVNLGAVETHRWRLQPDSITITPTDDYEQWRRATGAEQGSDPKTFQIASGFEVELIHSATADEGSWVSLASDSRGRGIIGLEKKGLLRLTLPQSPDEAVRVERVNESLTECRGLVFAHDSLYAMANGDKSLFRLRDTNGDDRFDSVTKLAEFAGDPGHGRNQLTLGPDGRVWGIFGDSVFEPDSATKLPPTLPFPTRAEKTRSGFVARFNEDATEIEVMVRGLRNPYGLDFNQHGDLFTYDADAEYDMGASWYRPTRVNHLLVGGDYGWRRVTRDWPPYFPDRADTPQPTIDIGKGSPTAVEFAAGDRFPPGYRNALFVLDWAYGRILAVHLTPRGSSYFASAETFLRGQPLNVTDIEFDREGNMMFITGGRGTQSAIYRVKYVGKEEMPPLETKQQKARRLHSLASRTTRQELELSLKSREKIGFEQLWPHLSSTDPWIRHAARVVLEKTPTESWRERALAEEDFAAALAARLALSRMTDDPPALTEPMFDQFETADERLQLEFLELAAKHSDEATLAKLHELYPTDSWEVNARLARILSQQPGDSLVFQTLALLERAQTQRERFLCLYVLRRVANGWTPELRRRYFEQLKQMGDFAGGAGLPTFRKLIWQEAIAALPETERAKYEALLQAKVEPWLADLPPARSKVVKQWTTDELAKSWARSKTNANAANGEKMFATARCVVCHRHGALGGTSGPDLTYVARRFEARDIIASIVEPSRVVSEKYAASTFELSDGRIITGRIAPGDYRATTLDLITDLLAPEKTTKVNKIDIVARQTSKVSPMPKGLVDTLTEQEVIDLLAYLLHGASGGSQ